MTRSLRPFCRSFAVAVCVALAGMERQLEATTRKLRSPWDAVMVSTARASQNYVCQAPAQVPPDLKIEGFYADRDYSVIDPEKKKLYEELSQPSSRLADLVAVAADEYRSTGNIGAARCAVVLLTAAAKGRALAGVMYTKQAYYVQGWIAGALAIDYLKVRNGFAVEDPDRRLIQEWLRSIAQQTLAYYAWERKEDGIDAKNNHVYWAALEIAAIAAVEDDPSLWQWSVAEFREATAEVTPDGTLPLEMSRRQRALHYHLFAASPLVMIAEFGCANGVDLYAVGSGALPRLADRALDGLVNNSYFATKAEAAQDAPEGAPTAEEIGWAKPYLARYPNRRFQKLLSFAPSLSYRFTGGLPPPANRSCGTLPRRRP